MFFHNSVKRLGCFNPNWTGQGQSWPRRLWPQIAGKLIKYFIFYFWPIPAETSSGSFWTSDMTSKMTSWNPFCRIFVRSLAAASLAEHPPPFARFYCIYRPPERGRSPAGPWSAVRCGASQKFQSVSGRRPHRVRGEAGSQSGPLSSSSKWTAGAAPIWGIPQNRRPL